MALIRAQQNRTITRDITILDGDGATITPNAADKVRAIIKRDGQATRLTVASDVPTSNGSTFAKGAANRLRLDADDLDFPAGTYTLLVDYYDNADSTWKHVSKQVFVLEPT